MTYVLGSRGSLGGVLGRGGGGAAAPWWMAAGVTPVAAYGAKGAASLAASYVNLANPGTYDAAPGVAPTWDAVGGWTFNGTTQYLTTGVVPASGWSMIVRFSDVTVASRWLCGCESPQFYLASNWSGGALYGANGFGFRAPGIAAGVIAIAGQQPYRNGATDGATVGSIGWTTTRAISIGAVNSSGTLTGFVTGKIQHVILYDTTLFAAQVATQSAAIAAL